MASPTPEPAPAADTLLAALDRARQRFLDLVEDLRPELHRYAARMTGSVADAEDVVQDTLARAYYQLPELQALPPLRPWLFRIAHNRAIDHWRQASAHRSEPLEAVADLAADPADGPEDRLAREQAVRAALSAFLQLAPAQRGCVILKDVLDHSLDEIADELDLSVPAVKAALHRGRALLRQRSEAAGIAEAATAASGPAAAAPALTGAARRAVSPELANYARLFNARDWDGVRALLAEDVRLDLPSRRKAAGRREVGVYFTNYARFEDWQLLPAWLEGREVLAVRDPRTAGAPPRYFVELQWRDGRVHRIRDFRHVPYIAQEAAIELADG